MTSSLRVQEELDENANILNSNNEDNFADETHDSSWTLSSMTPMNGHQDQVEDNKKEGTYVCAKCSNELFSSMARLSIESLPNFTRTIRNGALSRIPEKDSINSFQVACSKCLNHVGREVVDTSHNGQPTSHFTIVQEDVLRLVRNNKGKS